MGLSLWDWAVAVHQAPGVDPMLIALQDDHGQCVSYLLWAAWTAKQGLAADFAPAARLARDWERDVTGPLRTARRNLKRPWPPMDDVAREDLRSRVKAEEFDAEKLLLETMAAAPSTPAILDPRGQLLAAAEVWSTPAPTAAIDRLARILDDIDIW